MAVFTLEIGMEELPARFLPNLEKELKENFSEAFEKSGLEQKGLEVCSTPRRATVYVKELSGVAKKSEEVVLGPPLKIAFGSDGKPGKAAEGFAKTQNVTLEETFTLSTDKGDYLAVRKEIGGEKAADLLPAICSGIISSLSFPKRMKWGRQDFTFARPLRWILAMLDTVVIDFSVAGVKSGNITHGHRVHGPGPFALSNASEYFVTMQNKAGVTPRAEDRRVHITGQGNTIAQSKGGKVIWKEALLDEVQGLCEHPVPIIGNFSPDFLEIPREVLLTSMESHQKSFGLEKENGELLPYFLTILNISPKDELLVQKGWERVLRARLEDARFFWKTDLETASQTWLDALDKVIFLAPLGSMGDKTRRLEELCVWIDDKIGGKIGKTDAARAGRLSKADLVSGMVGEFDTLQGIMGGIYATQKGETKVVAEAIAEQYLPAGPDSPLPTSLCGAILSVADKADTLAGCFGLGMIPTGTADPYALRRAVLGIARVMQEWKMRFSVSELFAKAFSLYKDRKWKLEKEEVLTKLQDFFTQRLKNLHTGAGAETLLVEATILAGAEDVWSVSARLKALQSFSQSADFSDSVLTFKRAANIIRKQAQEANFILDGKYSDAMLEEEAEKQLASAIKNMAPRFDTLWKDDKYDELFALLRELRPNVDSFFNSVMVMCEDPKMRLNRLNILQSMVTHLRRLADFDALQL